MQKYLKTLLVGLLLAMSLLAQGQNFIQRSTPEDQVDVYLTLPTAAYDSIMLKSARYHCAIDGLKVEYDLLYEKMSKMSGTPAEEAEITRISDDITARKKSTRESYAREIEPYLSLVAPGTKVAFRNNSDRVEVTNVAIGKIESYRVPHSKWKGYRLWFKISAVNKIPMKEAYSDNTCGSDKFFLQWNVMVCDSRGREIAIEPLIYTDDEFWGKMYHQVPANMPRGEIVRLFDAGTAFEDILAFRISEEYDPLYDCPVRTSVEKQEVPKIGSPKPPAPPQHIGTSPGSPRNPGTSNPPAPPQKPAPPVDKPEPPISEKPTPGTPVLAKPAAQQNFAIRQIGTHYSEGLLPAKSDNGKWGYLNVDGEWVITPQFLKGNNACLDFSDGVAIASGVGFTLIYPDGKSLALPRDIQAVSPFRNGYAMVRMKGTGWSSKFGFIDKQGKPVFPHLTTTGDGSDIHPLGRLSEGLMRYYDGKERKFGYLNAQGEIVLAAQWGHAGEFSEGLAVAYNGDWGYIDRSGNWAIKPQWDRSDRPSDFHEGYAAVYKHYIDKSGSNVREMNSPYPFVGGVGYNTGEERLERLSKSFSVVKSIPGRYSPGKIDGVYQLVFPSGYCTLQRNTRPGEYEEMQATLVVDPELNIVLDVEKTAHLQSVGNFYDGRATAYTKDAGDWAADPDCVVDITGKIVFRIQK